MTRALLATLGVFALLVPAIACLWHGDWPGFVCSFGLLGTYMRAVHRYALRRGLELRTGAACRRAGTVQAIQGKKLTP